MQKRPWVRGDSLRKRQLRQRRVYTRIADAWQALRVPTESLRPERKPRTA